MARKPPKGKSLAEVNPELAKQWHATKNGNLSPADISAGSTQKVWWKCSKGNDHEWQAAVGSRNQGRGCSICSGKTIVKSNCLATINPSLAQQWHPTKNKPLTTFHISPYSGKKVWWKCDQGIDHEWQSSVAHRSNGKGCPICAGQMVVKSNCLATINPSLAQQWHPTKNKGIKPEDYTIGSNKVVWWKCPKGDDHEWKASIKRRQETGCSICAGKTIVKSNCLATTHPEVAKKWHPTKNKGISPKDVSAFSLKIVWWKCPKGDDHEWKSSVANITNGNDCSVCYGRTVVKSNCLATTHPKLANEWHPNKNGLLTPNDIVAGSNKRVWWKCPKGEDHEWKASVNERKSGQGCSICAGKTVVKSNCLATTHPKLANEWHPNKNGKLTPKDIISGSHKRVWWKCPKGNDHEWKASVGSRVSGNGCSICAGKKVVKSNCLATTHPKLANEWHPNKNGLLTPNDIVSGSGKKVYWKCSKGIDHEWKAVVASRANGRNCPYCDLTPQSKQELTITFELIQFFEDINPKGFKTRVKGKLWSIDIYIPQLKLGIEFDGSYWHKDKRALDKLKTERLEEDGFEIFRVREEPLKRIFEDDIMSKQPFNAKQLTNNILTQIMSRYTLDSKKIAKIESYIAKKGIQNEKGLDKYIEMILTEKAEKKK